VNFSYGIPLTAVSLAALVDGEVAAGAVVEVRSGETFSAHRGGGARRNHVAITCNHPARLDLCLVVTGYSYSAAQRTTHGRLVAELLGRVRDVRAFGSAALQWCWVAAGRVDVYLERDTKPWDYAAGSLIAAEAGAMVELPCPENDGLVLAAHPDRFRDLRPLL
jgi:myo-inositol-1(or 4)-monophosphatase